MLMSESCDPVALKIVAADGGHHRFGSGSARNRVRETQRKCNEIKKRHGRTLTAAAAKLLAWSGVEQSRLVRWCDALKLN